MTKIDLLKAIQTKVEGATRGDIEVILGAYTEVVKETLAENHAEKVTLPGIGAFTVKEVPERRGVSQIGEKKEWVKPAHSELAFKVTKSVRELV